MSNLQDFPIGFAEQVNNNNNNEEQNDTVFYVEWLDNASEFPGLASATTKSDLQGGNWELLQRKETNMDEDEHTINPLQEDASWSNLNTKQSEKPYAKVAEDAAELGPCKRTVKPLWSNMVKSDKKEKELIIIEDDNYDDLYYDHKFQSRRSNHLAKRQKLRGFKLIDLYIEGFFKVATSHSGKFTIVTQELEQPQYSSSVHTTNLNHRAAAVRYSSSFLGDPKPWLKNHTRKRNPILDVGEYNIYTPIYNEC